MKIWIDLHLTGVMVLKITCSFHIYVFTLRKTRSRDAIRILKTHRPVCVWMQVSLCAKQFPRPSGIRRDDPGRNLMPGQVVQVFAHHAPSLVEKQPPNHVQVTAQFLGERDGRTTNNS